MGWSNRDGWTFARGHARRRLGRRMRPRFERGRAWRLGREWSVVARSPAPLRYRRPEASPSLGARGCCLWSPDLGACRLAPRGLRPSRAPCPRPRNRTRPCGCGHLGRCASGLPRPAGTRSSGRIWRSCTPRQKYKSPDGSSAAGRRSGRAWASAWACRTWSMNGLTGREAVLPCALVSGHYRRCQTFQRQDCAFACAGSNLRRLYLFFQITPGYFLFSCDWAGADNASPIWSPSAADQALARKLVCSLALCYNRRQ